jgi:hypothetical protein
MSGEEAEPAAGHAIVVPGSGRAEVDGYRIGDGCRSCLTLAAALAERRRPRVVVFSGWSPVGGQSEAEQMLASWSGRRDVELLAEPTARITAENMSRSLPLLLERDVHEATIVCTLWHLPRVRFFFAAYRRYGIVPRYAAARTRPTWRGLLHEGAALPLMHLQRRRALAGLEPWTAA